MVEIMNDLVLRSSDTISIYQDHLPKEYRIDPFSQYNRGLLAASMIGVVLRFLCGTWKEGEIPFVGGAAHGHWRSHRRDLQNRPPYYVAVDSVQPFADIDLGTGIEQMDPPKS